MREIPVEYIKPFPLSGNRRHLKGGMELPVFLFAIWCAAMPAFAIIQHITLSRLWMLLIPVALFFSVSLVGRWMAAQDPYMTAIYLASLRYGTQYPRLAEPPYCIVSAFTKKQKKGKHANVVG
jgi:type IV secretory pathway TrbD component